VEEAAHSGSHSQSEAHRNMKFFLLTAAHRPAVFSSIDMKTIIKLGLTRNLRRIPADKIESASTNEKRELLMCGHFLIARLTIAVFVFLTLGVTSVVHAERPDSTAGTPNAGTRKLFIDPSSTSVALRGKASLVVSPLTHRDGNYVGDYQLKVRPYFFKNEKGSLLLAASDDEVRKLQAETAINFTGRAVTHKDGRTHTVLGRATPSSRDRGSVTFSIVTDDARVVFNTSYHFGHSR
jgi:hypothetical protein